MDQAGNNRVIKNVDRSYRNKTAKYARIIDPSNGDAIWSAVLQLPWHEPNNHIAIEEKLNIIGSTFISDMERARIVKMLDHKNIGRCAYWASNVF